MHTVGQGVSVVIPVYNEEGSVGRLCQEIHSVLVSLNIEYEIIFVNDGSKDKTIEVLKEMAAGEKTVKVLDLSRNFGETAALVCGVNHASKGIIILMDGDLQNDPKDIPMLLSKIEEGYDVVSGWRKDRKDALLTRKLPSFIANKIISLLCGIHLHDYGCTLKAYRKSVLKDVKLYGEMHRFIPVYASWMGAKIVEVPVNHRCRTTGKSKYNITRAVKVILDLVTIKFLGSYACRPIYVFGGSGLVLVGGSFICLLMLLYNKFVLGISMIQSPLLLLSALLVILGVQSVLMGLLAEMQIRTYFESSQSTIYSIKEKTNL